MAKDKTKVEKKAPKKAEVRMPQTLAEGMEVRYIPTELVHESEIIPRMEITGIGSLKKSIKAIGVLEPLLVKEITGGYEVVSGNRRLVAAREAKLASIPCIVVSPTDDQVLITSFAANVYRSNLKRAEKEFIVKAVVEALGEEDAKRVLSISSVALRKFLAVAEAKEEEAEAEGEPEPIPPMIILERPDAEAFIMGTLTEAILQTEYPDGEALVMGALGKVNVVGCEAMDGGYLVKWQNTP